MIERVEQKLKDKKVLFIAAKFYHYTEAVNQKLKAYGASVTFFYERDTSLRHVITANFFPAKMNEKQENHYKNILDQISDQTFDYLIVIRGYRMPVWFLERLKERNPDIYTIMYQWDRYGLWDADYRYLLPYFNRTLSFDYNDSAALKIPYVPTFHMDEYAQIEKSTFDFDFIYCTNHTDEKYHFMKQFLKYASEKGYKVHTHLYLSWLKYLKERLRGNYIELKDISFKRLGRKQYFNLFCKSKTVVDFSGSGQSGLTMRIIDALGSGKRVLTNNPNVIKEPGFDPRQVVIYDANNLDFPQYIADDEQFDKQDYSIDNWLDNLFFAT